MKIKYELTGFFCITKCKVFENIKVGSGLCVGCKYFKKVDGEKRIITCNYKKNIFKTILNKLRGVK